MMVTKMIVMMRTVIMRKMLMVVSDDDRYDDGYGDVAMTRRMSISSPVRLHRQRAGSIVDKLPMDLSTNIHSMRA